jgi:ABC-type phosphate/phosphonate transport system substrate-binding protein
MSQWIANARMYAVTPAVEAAWRELLEHIAAAAGVPLAYVPYPAPQPLEPLWARADSPYQSLEDTFGGRLGWTVSHSQSGFNALRHELLKYRSSARPSLYREVEGHLITARNVLDAVREGRIDVGPLDAYWHLLIARHSPGLTRGVRVLTSTPVTPIPGFVAAAGAPAALVAALREAFIAAAREPWFAALADALMIEGFAPVSADSYQLYLDWDAQARAAGYETPA